MEGEQHQAQEDGSNPITPMKEEAATALASLSSADDHEIAEALQKLANAFGITTQGGGSAKEAVTQLAALQQSDNPDFLLEGAGQVAAEEVVEEVVTDEPMVVIEGGNISDSAPSTSGVVLAREDTEDITSTTVQSIVDVVSAATQIAQSITGTSNPSVTQPVAESLIQAVANQLTHSATQPASISISTEPQQQTAAASVDSEPQPTPSGLATGPQQVEAEEMPGAEPPSIVSTSTPTASLSATPATEQTMQTTTSAPVHFLTEEVIFSEPMVETSTASGEPAVPIFETTVGEGGIEDQVEVLVQGGTEEMVIPSQLMQEAGDAIVQLSSATISTLGTIPASSTSQLGSEVTVTSSPSSVPPAHMITTAPAEVQVMTSSASTDADVTLSQEISIPQEGHNILNVVQETVVGEEEGGEGEEERTYEEDFKTRVVHRARELGSIQQAAREFSIPWKVVASWNTTD